MKAAMKKHEALIYSAVGIVALFFILVAANYLLARAPSRLADLTDGKLYTLSEGTKKILRNLKAPVRLKLYVSQGESMPVPLRSFAQRVEDLVRDVATALNQDKRIDGYIVESENFESIHNHSAYALIEKNPKAS